MNNSIPNLLEVKSLGVVSHDKTGKSSPKVILNDVSLSVSRSQITCLIGESGSGKSIFSRAISALLPENLQITGGWFYFNQNPVKIEDLELMRGDRIFYTPQNAQASLNPIKKIFHQYTDRQKVEKSRLKEILRLLDFSDPERILSSYPFQLSGGENQRCLLAMALIGEPELLILDEPTSGLDEKTQENFIDLLGKISQQIKLTVLLITHRLGIVQRISDFTYVIYQGNIVDAGPTSVFLKNPAHEYSKYLADNLKFF